MHPAERLVRDRQLAFDLGLCIVVSVVTVLYTLLTGERALGLASLVITLPLLVRRMYPGATFAVMTAGCFFALAVSSMPSAAGIVSVPIMVFTLARWSGRTLARLGWAVAAVGSFLGPARWALNGGGLTDLTVFMVSVVACLAVVSGSYVAGRKLRETQDSATRQRRADAERVRLQESEREQRARAASTDERNRIARELHDIVAHSLSVIVVQAEGGRALAARHPHRAAEVLGTIAETGREALTETRRILGVLREGRPGEVELGPMPGLADIAELVRRTSELAELTTFGTPPALSPAVGLTAYRVVQESLTNVLKHAGPDARARVVVACTGDAVEIEVVDDGRVGGTGPSPVPDGRGNGLRGMADRVGLHGGALAPGPGPHGGFVVRARIPYEPPTQILEPELPQAVSW